MMEEHKVIAVQVQWRVGWEGPDGRDYDQVYPREPEAVSKLLKLHALKLKGLRWQREEIKALVLPGVVSGRFDRRLP